VNIEVPLHAMNGRHLTEQIQPMSEQLFPEKNKLLVVSINEIVPNDLVSNSIFDFC
jgi:hypothetical protein